MQLSSGAGLNAVLGKWSYTLVSTLRTIMLEHHHKAFFADSELQHFIDIKDAFFCDSHCAVCAGFVYCKQGGQTS